MFRCELKHQIIQKKFNTQNDNNNTPRHDNGLVV